jgi:hypothetical protein
MGAVSLPLNNGNLTLPRITGNTSVGYIGTETDIPTTGMAFADLKLSAKKAADAGTLVVGRLEAWRQAWEAKDSARYLSFYGSAFVPAGNKPRAAWETDRRAKLGKKGEIKVQLGTPSIKADGEVVLVSFEQRYQSGNYSDVGQKRPGLIL